MYTIITDSCCDLNPELAKAYAQFEIVPLSYTMDGETRLQPIDDEDAVQAYYGLLRAGKMSTTMAGGIPEACKKQRADSVPGLFFRLVRHLRLCLHGARYDPRREPGCRD